jgi:hypothetical protein
LSEVTKETLYFDKTDEKNTDAVLKRVKEYADREDINSIVIASTTGETGARATEMLKGHNIVVVGHSYGFKAPGQSEMQEEFRKEITSNNGKIFAGVHALSSIERAIRRQFGTIEPLELVANVLRLFGEGTKVAVEITLMAADAGLIPMDKDVIAVGGTGSGVDTALLVHPAHTSTFFDLRIKEIIAKPH